MYHQDFLHLTPANPEKHVKVLGFATFDQVRLSDIAWVEEYKIGVGTGSMVLLNNGTFRCYLQSVEFIKRTACSIIGRMAMAGSPPTEDVPWALD